MWNILKKKIIPIGSKLKMHSLKFIPKPHLLKKKLEELDCKSVSMRQREKLIKLQ
jgi:hypothetical protein